MEATTPPAAESSLLAGICHALRIAPGIGPGGITQLRRWRTATRWSTGISATASLAISGARHRN